MPKKEKKDNQYLHGAHGCDTRQRLRFYPCYRKCGFHTMPLQLRAVGGGAACCMHTWEWLSREGRKLSSLIHAGANIIRDNFTYQSAYPHCQILSYYSVYFVQNRIINRMVSFVSSRQEDPSRPTCNNHTHSPV